jgi:hypothetical protein
MWPAENAPHLDLPFLNSTQQSGVEFKRERSQQSGRASNARQSEALRYAGGLGRAAHQWGQGAKPLRRGPGVCPHTPLARVRGAEPRNAKTKPLDHLHPKQLNPLWLRATSTVRCPLGQQHPTQIHALSKPTAFFSFTRTIDNGVHGLHPFHSVIPLD